MLCISDTLYSPHAALNLKIRKVQTISQSISLRTVMLFAVAALHIIATAGAAQEPTPIFIPAKQVHSILEAHADAPREMKGLSMKVFETSWPEWVAHRDIQVRTRVEQGGADSLANLLLYGKSYTKEPQVTDEYRETLVRQLGIFGDAVDNRIKATITARAHDLVIALANPGDDERRLAMLDVATRAGHGTSTPQDRNRLAEFLFENLVRYQNENRNYIAEVERAKTMAAPQSLSGLENMLASLYQKRGLSTDTSLYVNYALEQALMDLKEKGYLKPGSVIRVGIVGPGLDLIDKFGGVDLYPPQTTQSLILMDTLLRLKLSRKDNLRVSTFDINPLVNRHMERAANKARNGHAYTVHLVRNKAWDWPADLVRFWGACGDVIGAPQKPAQPPDFDKLIIRAIRVRPEWVLKIHAIDLNIVFQQLPLEPAECFDLLVATNIFCYYGPFEQALALSNAARMLRPGGILLSNTALPEIKDSGMHLVGSTLVRYSQSGADRIDWHQRDL